jgi:hypothetical protein
MGPLLPQVGRSQIDDHPETGPLKTIVAQGRLNSLLTFPYGMVGKAHNKKTNALGNVHFNGNPDGPNSYYSTAKDLDKHELFFPAFSVYVLNQAHIG